MVTEDFSVKELVSVGWLVIHDSKDEVGILGHKNSRNSYDRRLHGDIHFPTKSIRAH